METVDIQNTTNLRNLLYSFLSRSYAKEIDREYLLKIDSTLNMLKSYNEIAEDVMLGKGIGIMENFLGKAEDQNDLIEELALKYTTLFLNVSPNDVVKHVHPYESVYLSQEKLVMQEQRDEVLNFYDEYNIGIADDFKEPEDHIAVELAFLQKLNRDIYNDLSENNMSNALEKFKTHHDFMKQHLLRWIHLFGRDLMTADTDGFYDGLANITLGFVRQDFMYVREAIEYFENEI
ncbi:molecular chaperone [Flexistipes sinusarabici]|nr:molecular chaperone TorD family protein [Flexistipes sinusarabici]